LTESASALGDGTLLVYFGGHSLVQDDRLGLAMTDAARQASPLSMRDLRAVLDRAGRKVLFLHTSSARSAVTQFQWGPKTAILCAPDVPESVASDGGSLGFTGWLVRGIESGEADLDGDGRIDIGEVSRYITDGLWKNGRRKQPPLLVTDDPDES
jgi:hypothetical protein